MAKDKRSKKNLDSKAAKSGPKTPSTKGAMLPTGVDSSVPSVAIVGRPNVGKSSLFNCIVGRRQAVVVEESGTTRDLNEAVVMISNRSFRLFDTGGYLSKDPDKLSTEVKIRIERGVEEADLVIMVADAIDGVVPADIEILDILRRYNKEVILVINKVDNQKLEESSVDFYRLGLGDPILISCLHRRGIKEIKKHFTNIIEKDRVTNIVEKDREEIVDEGKKRIKISIVGRPNVGKSSFINYLLKKERVIVSDIPGTTRDSIDVYLKDGDDEYIMIDTAGIRHRRKIKQAVDVFSIMRAKDSIERSDVVLLIVDASLGFSKDDLDILLYVFELGKACILVVNKWDLAKGLEGVDRAVYREELIKKVPMLRVLPSIFISAKSGESVYKTLPLIKELDGNMNFKASTGFINAIFKRDDPSNVPVPRRKARPNFLYITQTSTCPPEFTYFVNRPGGVMGVHRAFIENKLRENLPYKGIPIRLKIKRSNNATDLKAEAK